MGSDEKAEITVAITDLDKEEVNKSSTTTKLAKKQKVKPKRKDEIPKYIDGFDYIAPRIWQRPARKNEPCPFLGSPASSDSSMTSSCDFNAPDLILLFSWTGAVYTHVSKYTSAYAQMYPSSTLIAFSSLLSCFAMQNSEERQQHLQPAVDLVKSHIDTGRKNILVHMFSDGGAVKAVEFAEAYQKSTGDRLPVQSICFDSTPGLPRYTNYSNAFYKTLPDIAIIRIIGCIVGYAMLGFFWIMYCCFVGRENNLFTRTRRRLNDPTYWNQSAPRCYLYSVGDDMMYWKDIEDHGTQAAKDGVPVVLVKFEKSAHCNHIKEDPQAYWEAVRTNWEMRDVEAGTTK